MLEIRLRRRYNNRPDLLEDLLVDADTGRRSAAGRRTEPARRHRLPVVAAAGPRLKHRRRHRRRRRARKREGPTPADGRRGRIDGGRTGVRRESGASVAAAARTVVLTKEGARRQPGHSVTGGRRHVTLRHVYFSHTTNKHTHTHIHTQTPTRRLKLPLSVHKSRYVRNLWSSRYAMYTSRACV